MIRTSIATQRQHLVARINQRTHQRTTERPRRAGNKNPHVLLLIVAKLWVPLPRPQPTDDNLYAVLRDDARLTALNAVGERA